jgi:hypothetical protein
MMERLLISELTARALLRNLRLLQGMRPSAPGGLRVAVAGVGASAVAARLSSLEPGLRVTVSGDGGRSLGLSSLAGARLDGLIISQPYHALSSREELGALRAALHPEEGSLGLLWARAVEDGGAEWARAYSEAAVAAVVAPRGGGGGGGGGGALPLLQGGAAPMDWVDALGLEQHGFQAPKHRKFVERLEGAARLFLWEGPTEAAQCAELLARALTSQPRPRPPAGPPHSFFEALPLIHDARLAMEGGPCAARRAGEAAAASAPAGGGLVLHQHAFHCAMAAGACNKPAKGV